MELGNNQGSFLKHGGNVITLKPRAQIVMVQVASRTCECPILATNHRPLKLIQVAL